MRAIPQLQLDLSNHHNNIDADESVAKIEISSTMKSNETGNTISQSHYPKKI